MKSKPLVTPLALLLVLTCGALAFFIYYGPALPPRVASHFDLHGTPNGWMDRVKFIVVMSSLSFMVPPFMAAAIGVLPRVLPLSMINLPNREYWLAPERRERSLNALMYYGLWLGCIVQGFLFGVAVAVFRANTGAAMAPLVLVGPLFAVAFVVWAVALVRAFGAPRAASS